MTTAAGGNGRRDVEGSEDQRARQRLKENDGKVGQMVGQENATTYLSQWHGQAKGTRRRCWRCWGVRRLVVGSQSLVTQPSRSYDDPSRSICGKTDCRPLYQLQSKSGVDEKHGAGGWPAALRWIRILASYVLPQSHAANSEQRKRDKPARAHTQSVPASAVCSVRGQRL